MWLRTISGNYVNTEHISKLYVSCPELEDRYWRVMAVLAHTGGGVACLGRYAGEAESQRALDHIIEILNNTRRN